jgi:cation transport ATPase
MLSEVSLQIACRLNASGRIAPLNDGITYAPALAEAIIGIATCTCIAEALETPNVAPITDAIKKYFD